MAGQPLEAVLLVGLGFRSLSMAPSAIPRVKEALRAVRAEDARALAERCLVARDVRRRSRRWSGRRWASSESASEPTTTTGLASSGDPS